MNKADIGVSASHVIGCLLTNFSYALLGATSTLVWKLCEPFATLTFKWYFLKDPISLTRFLGVCVVVTGVFIFSNFTLSNVVTFSPIIIANTAFPLRNVLIKLVRQSNTPEHEAPCHTYLRVQAGALPICLLLMVVKYVIWGTDLTFLPYLLRNAFYFNAYQFASIVLLSRLDALSHSLANTFKRFSGIFLSVVLVGTEIASHHVVGLSLTAFGFPLYIFGDRVERFLSSTTKKYARHVRCFVLLGTSLMLVLLSGYAAQDVNTDFILISAVTKPAIPLPIVPVPRVIRLSGEYKGRNISYTGYKYAVRDNGDNMGNLVWQYAAYDVIPNFEGIPICRDLYEACAEKHDVKNGSHVVHYKPVANAFNGDGGTFGVERNVLRRYGERLLIVGIGVQEYFGRNGTMKDMAPGRKIETGVKDFAFTNNSLSLMSILEDRGLPMLMRGDFTWTAAQRAGYRQGISLGCPSLLMNGDITLGEKLEAKYRALRNHIGDRSLKIAINIKTSMPQYFNFFKSILDAYPNSLIYAQGAYDMQALQKYDVPFHRVRFFTNVPEWRKSIAKMDISFGARIHGNMIAIAAEVPSFVIAPDHRVLELVQRMKIPHTTSVDPRLKRGLDIAKIIWESGFNGDLFDENRCTSSKVYERVFRQYGMRVSDHVARIAASC